MAILEVTTTDVLQRCENCETERRIPLAGIQAGVQIDNVGAADPTIVPLPQCPECNSFEYLIREPDDEPPHPSPGSFGHLHRLLVNQLHATLVGSGKVHPFLKDKNGKINPRIAKPVDKATTDKYFPGGLKIGRDLAGPPRGPGPGPIPVPGPNPGASDG